MDLVDVFDKEVKVFRICRLGLVYSSEWDIGSGLKERECRFPLDRGSRRAWIGSADPGPGGLIPMWIIRKALTKPELKMKTSNTRSCRPSKNSSKPPNSVCQHRGKKRQGVKIACWPLDRLATGPR